jgi:hypothetical protein
MLSHLQFKIVFPIWTIIVEIVDFVHNIWKKSLPSNFMPPNARESVKLVLNILFTEKINHCQ